MELLIIWILSIFVSLSMEFANGMKIFKFAADEGYKINREALRESNNLLSPEMQKKSNVSPFHSRIQLILCNEAYYGYK